ncbi:DUF2975 domain-containing protein [Gymnodinialimonas sp. 2305UL16-5]|uniref:DUF2975 domain-containing protein n=1 Tax=Gymnodinialimonas mytili TaxID=3126503 RepID=UPI0030A1A4F7
MNAYQLRRVTRLARVLHVVSTLTMILMPAFLIYSAFIGLAGETALQREYDDYVLPEVIPTWTVIVVRLIQMLGFALILYVLWQMRQLFALYTGGETLSQRCADRIRRCGQGLVTIGAFGILSNTLIVLLLTTVNVTGPQTLVVTFSEGDVGFFLGGGLMVVIGWVMGEAARIAEDNRGFV